MIVGRVARFVFSADSKADRALNLIREPSQLVVTEVALVEIGFYRAVPAGDVEPDSHHRCPVVICSHPTDGHHVPHVPVGHQCRHLGALGNFSQLIDGFLIVTAEDGRDAISKILFHFSICRALYWRMPRAVTNVDFQTIVESAAEAVIVYANGKFLYLNPFAAERLGATASELVGHPIMDFVHRDSVKFVLDRLKQLEETGKGGVLNEVRFVSRDGTVMSAEVVSLPIRFQGKNAILGLLRDVSQRAEAERALR